jgi:hypothetical protein
MSESDDKVKKPSGIQRRLDTTLKHKKVKEEDGKTLFQDIKYEKPPHY